MSDEAKRFPQKYKNCHVERNKNRIPDIKTRDTETDGVSCFFAWELLVCDSENASQEIALRRKRNH